MSGAFANGWIVDAILVLVAVEAIVLALLTRRRGRRALVPGLMANLLAGAFLLLALRCALVDARWPWIAAFLLMALVAHGFDLAARWRR